MADTPEPPAGKKSSLGFLGRKIGPVPIWVIAVGAVGAYFWYTHYGPGSKPAAAPAPARAGTTNITIRETEGRGPRGFRGRPGKDTHKTRPVRPKTTWPSLGGPLGRQAGGGEHLQGPVTGRSSFAAPARGPAPPVPQPATAAAPMTGGDVYGDIPVATPQGQTYDSGDVASTMGAGLALAG